MTILINIKVHYVLVVRNFSESLPLTCYFAFVHAGVVNEYSAEYDAMNVALNNTSSVNNVSIILTTFNISGSINMLSQGKIGFYMTFCLQL